MNTAIRSFPSSFAIWTLAAAYAVAAQGAPESRPVSFKQEIAPLLQRRCVACHGEESAKGGYRLDTFARLTKAGDSEAAPIVARKASESEFYRLLIEPEASDRMPQKAEALPKREIALIERWIAEGAVNDGGPPERPLAELVRETFLLSSPEKYARPIPVTALSFSPDGTRLAVAGYYEVTIWNVEKGILERRIPGLPERITSLAWHPKTRMLAVAGGSPAEWGTVALVDPAAAGQKQKRFLCDLPEMALSTVFSPDGSQLAVGSGDRTIRFFEATTGRQVRVVRPHADWVQEVVFSLDGKHLLSASRDRTLRVMEAASGQVETTYAAHETAVVTAMFSRDGKTVFSVAQNGPMHLWDPIGGRPRQKPIPLPGRTECLAWVSPDLMASGGADGLVRIHQMADQQILFTLHGHSDAVTAIAVSRTPDVFATGSHDGTVCVWDLACETWVQRFTASP